MNEEIMELAEQIWEYCDPWERCDYTPQDIAEQIVTDPVQVIKNLVEWLMDN